MGEAMKILGVDTSTSIGSVGLIDDGAVVAEHTLDITQAHSARLMPTIDQVLKWANMTAHDLDACAVGLGPGSFTGIRIGVGTIKTLCYALGKPIVGVSTLEAIAFGLHFTDRCICTVLDARRGEVYGAIFQTGHRQARVSPLDNFPPYQGGTEGGIALHGGGKPPPPAPPYQGGELLPPAGLGRLERLSDDQCVSIDALLNQVKPPALFVGDGLWRYGEVVRQRFGESVEFAEPLFNIPRGATIAWLGHQRLQRGEADDAFSIVPNYVRQRVT